MAEAPTDRFDPGLWRRLHEEPAGDADAASFREGLARVSKTALRRSAPGERWMDLGCGASPLALRLAAEGRRVIALDHDIAMLEMLPLDSGADGPGRVQSTAGALPFRTASLDGIAAASLFGCLADPAGVLHECHRVLAPGGRLIFTCSNRLFQSFLRPRASSLTRGSFRRYSEADVLALLSGAGFGPPVISYYNSMRAFPSFMVRYTSRNFTVFALRP